MQTLHIQGGLCSRRLRKHGEKGLPLDGGVGLMGLAAQRQQLIVVRPSYFEPVLQSDTVLGAGDTEVPKI